MTLSNPVQNHIIFFVILNLLCRFAFILSEPHNLSYVILINTCEQRLPSVRHMITYKRENVSRVRDKKNYFSQGKTVCNERFIAVVSTSIS